MVDEKGIIPDAPNAVASDQTVAHSLGGPGGGGDTNCPCIAIGSIVSPSTPDSNTVESGSNLVCSFSINGCVINGILLFHLH